MALSDLVLRKSRAENTWHEMLASTTHIEHYRVGCFLSHARDV